jgi:hypothetical protein
VVFSPEDGSSMFLQNADLQPKNLHGATAQKTTIHFSKFTPLMKHYAMKAYKVHGGKSPRIPDLGTR